MPCILISKLDKKIYKFIIVKLCKHKFKEKFFKSLRKNKMQKPTKKKMDQHSISTNSSFSIQLKVILNTRIQYIMMSYVLYKNKFKPQILITNQTIM